MKKFYVASSFKNKDTVRRVSNELKNNGFIPTYDWTQNERASTIHDLKVIGQEEKNAVMEADFMIVLLPGGKGSHIEFGIALGQGKRIYLYSSNDEVNELETTSTFYHLSEVEKCIGSIEDLIETVTNRQTV
ncbi:nucleoside 2-deoxyribosyltransferase [Alkalibacillus filiformis]|uniref:Nucleoside 2-deoxyribosyltransferase n=1 Tax=Alkalibacillus filiformis TaxID=200990 RepID=A0ABU0DPG3_9BACI|nr:nucleoside 2-deoxyribosyltransferase [Alkalibacillus filiformis]MDQ0350346.1 nucleoside 2-deoxyribosyltransferase [Alkalibacillus filiformis]